MLFLQDDGFAEILRARTNAHGSEERETNPQRNERTANQHEAPQEPSASLPSSRGCRRIFTFVLARLLQDRMQFLIRHDGRELGPYSEAEVSGRLRTAEVAPSDLALAQGA